MDVVATVAALPGRVDAAWQKALVPLRLAQSTVNGLVGDSLAASGAALAMPMVVEAFDDQVVTPHLVVLVHGLMATEDVFRFPGDRRRHYGTVLADELDATATFVRYNTGRPIPDNGVSLAHALEEFVEGWPVPVESITFVGHSMGGLVLRSACHVADAAGHGWPTKVRRVFLLGPPLGGAPLEQFAHVVSRALSLVPTRPTDIVGAVLDRRSAGIKDLRHGRIADPAHPGGDLVVRGRAEEIPVLPDVDYYVVAATLIPDERHVVNIVLGDLLVPVRSATAGFEAPDAHTVVLGGMAHLTLARSERVAAQLVSWLRGATGATHAAGAELEATTA